MFKTSEMINVAAATEIFDSIEVGATLAIQRHLTTGADFKRHLVSEITAEIIKQIEHRLATAAMFAEPEPDVVAEAREAHRAFVEDGIA